MGKSYLDLEKSEKSIFLAKKIRDLLRTPLKEEPVWYQQSKNLIKEAEGVLKDTPDWYLPVEWELMVNGIRVLSCERHCMLIAKGNEDGNIQEEKTRLETLIEEYNRCLDSNPIRMEKYSSPDELKNALLSVPLPTLYWISKEPEYPFGHTDTRHREEKTPLIKVIAFLDNVPLTDAKLIKPEVLYSLKFKIKGLHWPEEAEKLGIRLITTCPESAFEVSDFSVAKPEEIEDDEFEAEIAGNISFSKGQSSFLDDLIFVVSAGFVDVNGEFDEVQVIGQNELKLRVVNEERYPIMSGNKQLDRHIAELVMKLVAETPAVEGELPELISVLKGIARLQSTYAQEAIYKGKKEIPESEFQTQVLRDLRFLGLDVQEHNRQAGGFTDLKYHGVIIELKVEKEIGDRNSIAKRYTEQPTQYEGVEARQLSVLLVLDLTPKTKPPGDIRNDFFVFDVPTHGGEDESKKYPSKAVVCVINGNTRDPSSYSG